MRAGLYILMFAFNETVTIMFIFFIIIIMIILTAGLNTGKNAKHILKHVTGESSLGYLLEGDDTVTAE